MSPIPDGTLNYLSFQSFDFECTWWGLFQKRVMHTKFDIYFSITLKQTKLLLTLFQLNYFLQFCFYVRDTTRDTLRIMFYGVLLNGIRSYNNMMSNTSPDSIKRIPRKPSTRRKQPTCRKSLTNFIT
jgi:hypothetical protein